MALANESAHVPPLWWNQLPNPEPLPTLARKHGLSCYDATYLELAMRLSFALASEDDALRSPARRVGAPCADEPARD